MSGPERAGAAAPRKLEIRVRHVTGAPVAAVRLMLRGGARIEAIPGQAVVTGRALSEGSRQRDWRTIAEDSENLGMSLTTSAQWDHHGVSLDALAQDWRQALGWAVELVTEPSFPEERCRFQARQTAAELESYRDQPEVAAGWAFLEHLYAPSRLGLPLRGTEEGLGQLDAEALAAHHGRGVDAGVILSIAGEVDEDEVAAAAQGLLGRALGADAARVPAVPLPQPAEPVGLPEMRIEARVCNGEQAHLYMGHLTVPKAHPDAVALELVGVVLGSGAGLTGRIPYRIREQEGLAYTAQADAVSGAGLDAGRLIVYVGTSPATVEQAEQGVREELQRLLDEGIRDDELEEARAYLLGREPFQRETARQWADLLVDAELFGLPLDQPEWRAEQLRSLDRAAVEAAAHRHLKPDQLRATVGLPKR